MASLNALRITRGVNGKEVPSLPQQIILLPLGPLSRSGTLCLASNPLFLIWKEFINSCLFDWESCRPSRSSIYSQCWPMM